MDTLLMIIFPISDIMFWNKKGQGSSMWNLFCISDFSSQQTGIRLDDHIYKNTSEISTILSVYNNKNRANDSM